MERNGYLLEHHQIIKLLGSKLNLRVSELPIDSKAKLKLIDKDTLNLLELIAISYRIQYSQPKQLRLHDALFIVVFLLLINLL